jgi:hypothetical protein
VLIAVGAVCGSKSCQYVNIKKLTRRRQEGKERDVVIFDPQKGRCIKDPPSTHNSAVQRRTTYLFMATLP